MNKMENQNFQNPSPIYRDNKKVLAGVLAIMLGGFGIHKFILGYTKEGVLQILMSFFSCGLASVIPFVEGIIYLTKSDEEFYQIYQVGRRPWF
ncbi:MAG: TM2 domain-containing protein [Flavobacteriaceae bacterium]|jgi:TM2 domain containing protein+B7201|nr:TM2 domain-containing protein [Flavobacteriaceae bacterium]MBB1574954.1 TM2 domain-containing protein [Flavobacteriaceae bacterium]